MRVVLGVASSRLQANRIVDHLANAGFARAKISVLFPDGDAGGKPGTQRTSHAGRSAAQIGLAVGGAIGWLAGWTAFSVPGFGHLIAVGPLGAVLTGATTGSTTVHGVKRALVRLGLQRESAELYQDQVRDRQILVSLQTSDWHEVNAARKIFLVLGATNITISGPKASRLLARGFSEASPRPAVQTPEAGD